MIPQSVDPQDPAAHPPPFMVVSQFPQTILAPILTLTRQGSADAALSATCHCELLFQGITVEADPDITLSARWFVDYDVGVPTSTKAQQQQTIPPMSDEPKSLFRTLPDLSFDAGANGIVQSGVHVLEVVVGETNGFDDSTTAPRPFRTMKKGYLTAEYRFVLNVTLEQVPGQCPRTPPSVAVSCQ